ncbi:MAG: RNA ligase family protein [Nitrososphaerales archaeon]
MSDALPNYVLENYAKAVKIDLGSWLGNNPLPSICEPKYDGIRVFLFKSKDRLVLSSKHGAVYTPAGNPNVFAKVPEFTHAPNRMILDGEYVSHEGIYLFDVIQIDNRDVRPLILEERNKILHEILEGTGLEVEMIHARTMDEILKFKEEVIARGGEGVVVKNPLSQYGAPNSWLKLKRFDTMDCFVLDYEETQEMKKSGVPRSWFVGVYDEKRQIVNLGKVGSFVEKVDPSLVRIGSVIEVRFQEVTDDLKLRAPFILRVRHDKTPRECLFSQISGDRKEEG